MKKFFYAAFLLTFVIAVHSCKDNDDPTQSDPQPVEDTSGYGTIIFKYTGDLYCDFFIDNKIVKSNISGGTILQVDSVKAGMRILYAQQSSGGTGESKTKEETLKVLTNKTYTWEFP